MLGAIAAGIKVVEVDPKFDNPLSYVAKIHVDNLKEEQKRKAAETVPVQPIRPLNDIPLLSDLRSEELAIVARSMRCHSLREEETVFREGDRGESLFFVNTGLLEARSATSKLGLISSGQCFGEFSFLTGQPRTATVRALEESELLELSAVDMQEVSSSQPRLRDVLFRMYRDRALVNVLALCPLFEVLGLRDRTRLAPQFELLEVARGQAIFRQGETGGALYLIKTGSVEVRGTTPSGESIRLATLTTNQFFGEVSFLTGVPRTATVHALEGSELLKISEDKLKRLVTNHPFIKDVLSRFHLDRVMATAESLKAFLKQDRVSGIIS